MSRTVWRFRIREPDGSIRQDHMRAESADEVIDALRIREVEVLSVEQVDALDDRSPESGGNLNGVALCTAGFGVYDSNSGLVDSSGVPLTFGLLTAEHCDIYNHQTQTRPRRVINPVNGAVSTYDRGRTAMVNGQPVWFRGDAIVFHTGDFASHRVHATFNGVPVQIPIDHFGYPWDGTVLCAYGRRSNQVRCNMQVSGSWVTKNAGGQSHVGFNMFPTSGPDYMLPGDSGGPYYMGSTAYGVHQGQSTQGSAGSFMTGVALVLWAYDDELLLLAGS